MEQDERELPTIQEIEVQMACRERFYECETRLLIMKKGG